MLVIQNKRIPRHAKSIRRFVKWINQQGDLASEVKLYLFNVPILDDDQLELIDECYDTNEDSVGVYDPETAEILVAVGAIDCTTCLNVIAHEYYHAIQHSKGKTYREGGADTYASNALLNYQLG